MVVSFYVILLKLNSWLTYLMTLNHYLWASNAKSDLAVYWENEGDRR